MSERDLRLVGAQVLLPGTGLAPVDIHIADGKIAGLVEPGHPGPSGAEVVDVSGRVVMPGAIDAHVHLGQDITLPRTPRDVAAETASAAAGGVTTLLAYLMTPQPYEEVFGEARGLMAAHAHTNFGFHFCLVTPEQVRLIPRYIEEFGVSSYKFFMNFRGDEGAYLGLPGLDDGFLWDLLSTVAEYPAMAAVHAENVELIWRRRREMERRPDDGLEAWNLSRPTEAEAEATRRVAYLAGLTDASLYFVHVTCEQALVEIERHRRVHQRLYAETCPHYLTLDETAAIGARGKVNPPLRTAADREALWNAIERSAIDVIGSDHVPRHWSAKDKDIWSASAGFPGSGTLLPLLVSKGHLGRRISLSRIAEVTSTRPAQLFGLYPRKGVIAPGADADLVVLELGSTTEVRTETQHSAAEYTVWEGWTLDGSVVHTLVGGRFAVRDRMVCAPTGQYQHRSRSGELPLPADTLTTNGLEPW